LPETRSTIVTENKKEAAARLLFGTDGIRGVANEHPMTPELALTLGPAAPPRLLFGHHGTRGGANEHPMAPELALRLGRAVTFVAGRGKTHPPRILIGKDTRLSGYMLETALAS